VRRLALALAFLAAAGGAGALVEAGCATTQATGEKGDPPDEHAPDGGWASFVPGPSYEPKPMESAAGSSVTPQMNPSSPVSPAINPSLGH
jgi:hypothetical protein